MLVSWRVPHHAIRHLHGQQLCCCSDSTAFAALFEIVLCCCTRGSSCKPVPCAFSCQCWITQQLLSLDTTITIDSRVAAGNSSALLCCLFLGFVHCGLERIHGSIAHNDAEHSSVFMCCCRYNSIMQPAARFVCSTLDEGLCPGSTNTDLCFGDLSHLPRKELGKLCAWMTGRVDAIASGHAQVLMQIDTQLKVCHLLLCP